MLRDRGWQLAHAEWQNRGLGGFRAWCAGEGREAVGREAVVYEFEIPEDMSAQSAQFHADVSDDYRIGLRQVYDFPGIDRKGETELEERVWPDDFVATEAGTRRPFRWDVQEGEEPYYTVARSEGIGRNSSNRRVVRFDHGIPTGQNIASVDFKANLVGLRFSGEIAHNLQNFIYPLQLSNSNSALDFTYSVVVS
mgnify:CR=1 FL=1